MKYLLILFLMFGLLYSAPTIHDEYDLNPSGTMTAKNSMSGTFGNGYLGETVEYGDILHQNADGKWYKFDGTAHTTLVMSSDVGKKGKWHEFLISGYATKYNWAWTVGTCLYPSAGEMTQVNPANNENVLGVATKTDEVYFDSDCYIAGSGTYLPLAGGTMTGDILSDGTDVDIGSTGEPFDSLFVDYAKFTNDVDIGGTTTLNGNVIMGLDGTYDIGTALVKVNDIYTQDIVASDEVSGLSGTFTNLTGTRVVFVDTSPAGRLMDNSNFTYDGTNLDVPKVNTGQGDYELFAMNQDVETTDAVSFAGVTSTSDIYNEGEGTKVYLDYGSSGVEDHDVFIYFGDDGNDTAHYIRWNDGFSVFQFCNGDVVVNENLYANGNLNIQMDTTDVSNPPTDAELDGIWTSPATVYAGFIAYIDDNGDGTNIWQITSDGTNWWYTAYTKAL